MPSVIQRFDIVPASGASRRPLRRAFRGQHQYNGFSITAISPDQAHDRTLYRITYVAVVIGLVRLPGALHAADLDQGGEFGDTHGYCHTRGDCGERYGSTR